MKSKHMAVPLLPLGAALMATGLSMNTMAAEESATVADEAVLSTVNVEAGKDSEPDSYRATKTRVGKVLQDPHDVPQAVTTVTGQLIHDQQVSSLRDALRNVSGLTFNAGEGGRAGDNMMLRGFYTFGDIYLDGIRDTAQYNRETFNLEQVDVLRGSAAMLFGRGQAGGVINQVTKMAKLEDENKVSASLGDYSYHQLTGDFNKTLGETVAIRLNVMDRGEDTTRKNPAAGDRTKFDRSGIALSFGAGIGTDNELFINHIHTQTRDVPDYGIRFDQGKPRKEFYDTTWSFDGNFDDSDTRVTTGIFTHKFSEKTQWRTQLRRGDYERAYWVKTPPGNATLSDPSTLPSATGAVGGNQARKIDYETVTLQSDFITEFDLAGMKHEVITGVEYMHEDSYRQSLRNINPSDPTRPIYRSSAVVTNGNTGLNEFDSDSYSYFVQDSIEFIKNWKFLLGVRRDHMKSDYFRYNNNIGANESFDLNFSETSYRTGLSWQPSAEAHYYVTYSDSFSPTADLYQLSNANEHPESSETLEVGAKWLFFDGDLALRTAIYTAEKEWERNTDLESTASILTKKRRTNGIEIEAAGRITDHWEVFAGLALMDAYIVDVADGADPRFKGERARNTPPVTANLWTTYSFWGNWKVGLGFEAKGERYGYSPTQTVAQTSTATGVFRNGSFDPNTLPGFVRWDAMVSYEQKRYAVRFNVKNLFDKEYYDALYDNGGLVVPGNRRVGILTTEVFF
jgi:catecholate siderophore receptor